MASERQIGYFGLSPEHSSVAARNVLRKMGIPITNTSSFAFFEDGLDAIDGKRSFCIGVYDGAAIIAGVPSLIGTVEDEKNEFIKRFVALYPEADVFAFDLNSSTNYFAYVLFEHSILRRKVCGDASRGLILNKGPLLNDEVELLKAHRSQDLVENGEALTFNICKRFFGCPFDEFCGDQLHVEIVRLLGPVSLLVRRLFY
jgi:hypothetical protein